MQYFAHSKENQAEEHWQLLVDHLNNTAAMAKCFADRFHSGEFAYIIGLLHDIGKYSKEFQKKLKGENLRVDHSTAGAKEAVAIYGKIIGKILAYSIAGHHAGLPDYGNGLQDRFLQARLEKEVRNYAAFKAEIEQWIVPPNKLSTLPVKPITKSTGFTIAFFIRMLYSCLTDADFLDTEAFLSTEPIQRGQYPSIITLHERLNRYLTNFVNDTSTRINQKRSEIQRRCIDFAANPPGMYTLTVPTGGGKTISSLAFALKHAQTHGLERIIYVIPYTSIIEQNAAKFKEILGEETVLEHHSNIQNDRRSHDDEEQLAYQRMKLATENWDVPVVVTTNVQFYESLFGNRSSRCRKLHNIAKSVIILDEAQMIPVEYLKPCLYALSELVVNYGSTVVLCTATQPALQTYLPAQTKLQEMMVDPDELYRFFRRVEVVKRGVMTDELLADELQTHEQTLCIVNTKTHAMKLYEKMPKGEGVFHLSTLMCPKHRRKQLNAIRENLRNRKKCQVISTQLIEAGVDVDFPIVYRSMAGIDSIVQSAGRCNREGKAACGQVHVFTSGEDYGRSRGWLQRTAEIGEMVFRNYEDVTSLEAVKRYFELMYDLEDKRLDQENIIGMLDEKVGLLEFDFEEIAQRFKIIDDHSYTIIIPYDDIAESRIQEALYSPYPAKALRQLQPYTVSVYEYQYQLLLKEGVLDIVNDMLIILKDKSYYSEETGLLIKGDLKASGEALFA